MDYQLNLLAVWMLFTAIFSTALALYTWRQRPLPGAVPLAGMMAGVASWSLGYALELGVSSLDAKLLLSNLYFVAAVSIPCCWSFFALRFARRDRWLTHGLLGIVFVPPILMSALVWSNRVHHLARMTVELDTSTNLPMLVPDFGIALWLYWLYALILMLCGAVVILRRAMAAPSHYPGRVVAVLAAVLIPGLASVLYLAGHSPIHQFDLTPISLVLTGLVFSWSYSRHRLPELVPGARQMVSNTMRDGVILLDGLGRVVDMNPTAQRVFDLTFDQVVGQLADRVLPDWFLGGTMELGRRIVTPDRSACFFDLQVVPLMGHACGLGNRLVMLSDVSDQRRMEDALRESEARYRDLFENALMGIYRMAVDGRLLAANPRLLAMLGYASCEELAEMGWNLDDPDRPALPGDLMTRLMQYGELQGVERVWVRKDGTHLPVLLDARALLDDQGIVVCFQGTAIDLSERKRYEEALQAGEVRYRTLFDQTSDAILIENADEQILDANAAVCRLVGYTHAELLTKKVSDLKPAGLDALPRISHLQGWQSHALDRFETRVQHRDGGQIPVEIAISPLPIGDDNLFLTVLRDIS